MVPAYDRRSSLELPEILVVGACRSVLARERLGQASVSVRGQARSYGYADPPEEVDIVQSDQRHFSQPEGLFLPSP